MHPAPSRTERLWRSSIGLLVLSLAAALVAPACSPAKCKELKGSGSAFASVFCGGEGDDAPVPVNDQQPNFCSNIRGVMPAFFTLMERSDKPLAGLRAAVAELGHTQCLQTDAQRSCRSDDDCEFGSCDTAARLCPCTQGFNPLADLLGMTFRGMASISRDANETSSGRCASATEAASLPAGKINRMCEVRRTLDVLLQQNGADKVLNDPNLTAVLLALLDYVQGKGYSKPHYDLFTTMGRMAGNPGVCDPLNAYALIDKLLGWLTPANAVPVLDHLAALLDDPEMQTFLSKVSNGGSEQGRAAVITIAKSLMPSLIIAKSGQEAMGPITDLVNSLVLKPEAAYSQAFKNKVKAVLDDVGVLLGPQLGLWEPLRLTLVCLNNPDVDKNGELIGAIYDLVSLRSLGPSVPGVDLPTLLKALKTIAGFDPTGQVTRTLRMVVNSIAADEAATEAVRQLLAEALTEDVGRKLTPSLAVMIQAKVLGEVFTLLDDLLYECKQPR